MVNTRAIWLLLYDIEANDREQYVTWLNDAHIPEKLSRPGYLWAAHYEAPNVEDEEFTSFVAMFGGESTATFLDPNPKQLKTLQDAETREMMPLRQRARSAILAHEWSSDARAAITAFRLEVALLRPTEDYDDEDIGAISAQELAHVGEDVGVVHKLIGVTGDLGHVLLLEHGAEQAADDAQPLARATEASMPGTVESICSVEQLWRP